MQHVAHVLQLVAVLGRNAQFFFIVFVFAQHLFLAGIVFRQHVELEQVDFGVVVQVGGIQAHPKLAGMRRGGLDDVFKSPVTLIEVQDVAAHEVIRAINVGVAVLIQVGNGQTQPQSFEANASLSGCIYKNRVPGFANAFIAEEFVGRGVKSIVHLTAQDTGVLQIRGGIEQKSV